MIRRRQQLPKANPRGKIDPSRFLWVEVDGGAGRGDFVRRDRHGLQRSRRTDGELASVGPRSLAFGSVPSSTGGPESTRYK